MRALRDLPAAAALVALGTLLAASPALAAPDCESLDESEFIALVLDGQAAVDRGNPDTHRGIVDGLRQRIPCLVFVPRPRVLADYLVLDALAQFGAGGDWQTPLASAIRIRPGVDRVVGAAHPIARFVVPATAPTERQPIPEGTRVYVDGDAVAALPPTGELHLIQVADAGLLRTGFFKDEPVPLGFLTDPIEAPLVWEWWGQAGVVLGAGGVSQRRAAAWEIEADQNAFAPNQDRVIPWPAVVARGGAAYGIAGIVAELDVGLAGFTRPVGSHAQVAVVFGRPSLRLGAGAGVGGSTKIQGVNADVPVDATPQYTQTSDGMPYILATGLHQAERFDAGVSGGFGPAAVRGAFHLGWTRPAKGDGLPLRIGASGSAQGGWFVLGESVTDEVTTVTWRAGLELGVRP